MKGYFLLKGNEIVDVVINDGAVAKNTYDFVSQGNEYVKYELIELELQNNFTDGINLFTVFKLNSRPYMAVVNNFRNVIEAVEEIEKNCVHANYTYTIRFVKKENEKYIMIGA